MSQNNTPYHRLSNDEQLEIYAAKQEAKEQAEIAKQQSLEQTLQNIDAQRSDLRAKLEQQGFDPTETQEDDRDFSTPLHQYLQSNRTPRVYPEVEPEVIPELFTPSNWDHWDCQQAVRMLRVLGFENGDRCYVRALPAKGISEEERKKRLLAKAKDFYLEFDQNGELSIVPYDWKETGEVKDDGTPKYTPVANLKKVNKNWGGVLAKLNLKGYGIYLIPNKGGRFNHDITHWQSIFFEVDDRSLDDQKAQTLDFAQKTGVKPTLRVRTKKGFHNYYRFVKSEWQLPGWTEEVAKPTVLAMQSDPSITNNARLMRLAGFYHVQMKKGTNEIEYQRCDIVEYSPDAEYTREEFKAALLKYSGREYSAIRSELLTYVNSPTHKDYRHNINRDLFPLNHQICECPDELIEELNTRTRLYLKNLKDDEIDPEDAWFKDVSRAIVSQRRYREAASSGKWNNKVPGAVPDVIRWAKYLYGYNPNGRDGWITAQDPLIPESERSNHSIDSLHINAQTGAFKSHRGSDSKDIYAAMRDIAKKANPSEFVKNDDVAQVDFLDLDAPLPEPSQDDQQFPDEKTSEKVLTKEEFEAANKKVKLTEQEQQDRVIAQAMLAELKAAEDAVKLDKYFEQYSVKNQKVHKYFECNERYLSDETFAQFPAIQYCQLEGQILGLKAPKGTGKSYRIKQYIKQAKKAGWLVVSVTPRKVLGQSQAKEWGISWIADDGIHKFTDDEVNTMSCCWDSLHKLRDKVYGDKPVLLIIDEVESGLEHVTLSSTCKSYRAKIFQQLRRITTHIANKGGLILCADADMSNVSIDYLQTIARDIKTTVIDNTFQEKKKRLIIYYGKPGEVKFRIKEAIEEGTQFLFCSDSKKEIDTMFRWTMDYLKNTDKKDLQDKFWHLTSDTVIKEQNTRRLLDINTAIRTEKPFAIFYTPTLSVGTSIDASHFMEGFGVFKGAVLPDSARQMVARQREFIPWTIFADNMIKNDRKSPDVPTQPLLIKKQLYRHLADQELVTSKVEEMLARQGRPVDEIEEAEYSQARVELSKLLQADYRSIDTAECQLFACLRARENFQLQNYFEVFRIGMVKEGWKVTVLKGSKTAYCDELKELRLKIVEEESLAIAESDCSDIQNAEVAAQLLQESSDPVVRNSCKKFQVSDISGLAPEQVNPELVKKVLYTSGRYMRGVRYQWLYENPNISKLLAEKKMKKYAKELYELGLGCPHDAVDIAPEIEALREFGILNLVDLDDIEKKYCKKDIIALTDKIGLKYFNENKRLNWCKKIGIPCPSRKIFYKSPVQYILKPILAKFGFSLEEAGRGHNDNYYRIPKEELMDEQRDLIKEAWHQKHLQAESDRAIRLASYPALNTNPSPESNALVTA